MRHPVDSTLWYAPHTFEDRGDAGRQLAQRLSEFRHEDPIVLALPRGGVPVAFEIAEALHAPLDVFVVRKVGHPRQPELGLGAIAEGHLRVIDEEHVTATGVTPDELERAAAHADAEVEQRVRRLRGDRPAPAIENRTVIVVDDGIATGGTARAAALALRQRRPRKLILAVGVAPPESVEALRDAFDEIVCIETPSLMFAIGAWYQNFGQVPDGEVARLLELAASRRQRDARAGHAADDPSPPAQADPPDRTAGDRPAGTAMAIEIPIPGGQRLDGDLVFPERGRALVLFAHGSGSSRLSPRNRQVAGVLNEAGIGTLLFDLLTPAEETDRTNVFDIPLLAGRLVAATTWLRNHPELRSVPLAYFGASTGAGAALWAAAEIPGEVAAVVSRGGRPDLAWLRLAEVRAPVLLIVGGADDEVLRLNREALHQLSCPKDLAVVPGATHLFEEPGALERVAALAVDWFVNHMAETGRPAVSAPR